MRGRVAGEQVHSGTWQEKAEEEEEDEEKEEDEEEALGNCPCCWTENLLTDVTTTPTRWLTGDLLPGSHQNKTQIKNRKQKLDAIQPITFDVSQIHRWIHLNKLIKRKL